VAVVVHEVQAWGLEGGGEGGGGVRLSGEGGGGGVQGCDAGGGGGSAVDGGAEGMRGWGGGGGGRRLGALAGFEGSDEGAETAGVDDGVAVDERFGVDF